MDGGESRRDEVAGARACVSVAEEPEVRWPINGCCGGRRSSGMRSLGGDAASSSSSAGSK
jgi:hypothetical protein